MNRPIIGKALEPLTLLLVLVFFAPMPAPLASCGAETHHGSVRFATGFEILAQTSERTVIRDSMNQVLTVFHKGEPRGDALPHAYRSPVKRVVSSSAPAVPLINAIGQIDSLVGVKLPQNAWHIQEVQERMAAGKIALIGDGSHEYVDYERAAALNPDIIFDNIFRPGRWSALAEDNVLKVGSIYTRNENTLLGQFEWIKMLSVFYGAEKQAAAIFKEKVDHYDSIKGRVRRRAFTPNVLWGFITPHKASVPGGSSFIANAIADAGGKYVCQEEFQSYQGGYLPCDLEVFFTEGVDADLFILSSTKAGGIKSLDGLVRLNGMLKKFKSIQTRNVWCYQPWFWQSVDKPDEILEDIAAILHPEIFPGHKVRFFCKLKPG